MLRLREIGTESDQVMIECAAYSEMAGPWKLIDALLGGRTAMQAGGKTWLKKEDIESEKAYQSRLERSHLFSGYQDATSKLIEKPFQRPVTIKKLDSLSPALQAISDDANGSGQSLTKFASTLFHDLVHRGITHFYVDLSADSAPATDADILGGSRHPYFVHVPAARVIGWRDREGVNGKRELTQVRIVEYASVDAGDFGTKLVRRVRVWYPQHWELWQAKEGEEKVGVLIDTDTHELGGVPLITVNIRPMGFMVAKPPLEALADLNLEHYQLSSDESNSMHYASIPFLHRTGVPEGKQGEPLQLSSSGVLYDSDTNARVQWIESSGGSLSLIAGKIARLEDRMQKIGMAPMLDRVSPRTATEASSDRDDALSTLHSWVGELNDALFDGYKRASELVENSKLPKDFAVSVYSEWQVAVGDSQGQTTIMTLMRERKITDETGLSELNRRGVFAEGFNPEDEVRKLSQQSEMPNAPTPEQIAELERIRAAKKIDQGKLNVE